MDYVMPLAGLFLVHVLALASPGPNVLVVTQTSMSRERRSGVFVALGLATGAAIWSTAALVRISVKVSTRFGSKLPLIGAKRRWCL